MVDWRAFHVLVSPPYRICFALPAAALERQAEVARLTILSDIAGQVTRSSAGSDLITTAAIAIDADDARYLRGRLVDMPKWAFSSESDAENVVGMIRGMALSSATISTEKTNPEWNEFWDRAPQLQSKISSQDRRPANFARASNVLRLTMFGDAITIASAKAVERRRGGIVNVLGREIIDRTIICDSDIAGESVEVFRELWDAGDVRQPLINTMGLQLQTRDVIVTSEDEEPLLLLPDYLAGLGHAVHLEVEGRIKMPLPKDTAARIVAPILVNGHHLLMKKPFQLNYREIFDM
jgi:hypothetical protein